MDVRRFLRRLRPAGTPGAAAGTGVPLDRRAALEAELAPVFAALRGAEDDCARIRREAAARAERTTAAAAAEAARLLAAASSGAPAVRAEAMESRLRQGRRECDTLLAAADREAGRIAARAASAAPRLVAAALEAVRSAGEEPA